MRDGGAMTKGAERDQRGERTRIGLMIPSSNTMMEADFARELPVGWTPHTARMYMKDPTAAGANPMLAESTLPAPRDLPTPRPHVAVSGATSAGPFPVSADRRS